MELLALGRADAAREQYSGMLAANPDDLSAMLGLAEIELLAGDGDACIARCDAAAAVHPQQASAYRMKCRALLQLGRADAARRVADQAGALLRNSIEATLLRLDVLRSCGDRAALALLAHPPFAETTEVACWLEALLTRLAFFDLDGAAAMLDRPPVLRPSERARALSAAGQLAELQWRIADAIGCYERAIDIQPVDPGTHHALARLHLLRADAGRAAAHLRTATEQSGSALALRGQSSNASQNLVGQLLNELRLDPPMGAQLASLADDAPLRQVERLREIVAANPAATPPALCLMRALREAGAFAARDAFDETAEKIPRRITQFCSDARPPADVARRQRSWADTHPGYACCRYDRATAIEYLAARDTDLYLRAFLRARHPTQASDLLRLAVLFHDGGYFIDAGVDCVGHLSAVTEPALALLVHQLPYRHAGHRSGRLRTGRAGGGPRFGAGGMQPAARQFGPHVARDRAGPADARVRRASGARSGLARVAAHAARARWRGAGRRGLARPGPARSEDGGGTVAKPACGQIFAWQNRRGSSIKPAAASRKSRRSTVTTPIISCATAKGLLRRTQRCRTMP